MSPEVQVRVAVPRMQTILLILEHDLVLGRDCQGLLLADPQVSRRHLRLRPVDGLVEVTDLNSTNGSYLDGTPLRKPQLVDTDCVIIAGDTAISLMFGTADKPGLKMGTSTSVRTVDDLRSTSIELLADVVDSERPEIDKWSLADSTITIVFSDIESSTERATEMGDARWFELLERHNKIIRDEVRRYGGREVKSIGDGFMLAFRSVSRGLRFAIAVQRQVEGRRGPDLRVRIGLHTGEAIINDSGDLFGRHINMAARVANLADGGQVLASLVVKEIAAGRNDAIFGEPVQVKLKGFADHQTVFEVDWPKSIGSPFTNP